MADIIVEDGSGVDNANAYTTVSGVDVYCDMYGYTSWDALTEDQKKTAMFKSKRYLDGLSWKGTRLVQGQDSAFPRANMYDGDDELIAEDVVPTAVVNAFCEVAYLFIPTSDVDLEPIVTKDDYLSSEGVADVVTSTWGIVNNKTILPKSVILNYTLKGLLKSSFIVAIYRS